MCMYLQLTYVHRPEFLLHVVGGNQVQGAREFQEQIVFEAEDRGGSHKRRLRVDTAGDLLASSL